MSILNDADNNTMVSSIIMQDSMDFDENVEPVLSSYEKNLEIVNKQRTNPFNGVCIVQEIDSHENT